MARTPAPPKEETPPPPPKDDEHQDDEHQDDDDGTITKGELEEMVAAAVAKAITPAPKADDPPAPKDKRTAGDVEEETRRRVEAEVAKVREKDEIVGRLAKVEEAVKPVEEAPKRLRRSTKFWWG